MNILVLKLIRIGRFMKMIPIFYALFILLFSVILIILLFEHLGKTPNIYFIFLAYTYLLFSYHQRRTDIHFLQLMTPHYRTILLIEYLCYSFPLIILILCTQNRSLFFIPVLLSFSFSILSRRRENDRRIKNSNLFNIFPGSLEWVAGCRRYWLLLLCFLLLSYILLFKPYLSWISYVFCLFQCCDFYRECESRQLLCLPEKAVKSFLERKILQAWWNFTKINLPFYLLYLLLHIQSGWMVPLFILSSGVALSFCVLTKYAYFQPNEKYIPNQMINAIGVLCAIIPPLLPVTLLLSIRYYILAHRNLNFYLYAYS